MFPAEERLHLIRSHTSVGRRSGGGSSVGVEGVQLRILLVQPGGEVVGHLADHVTAHGKVFETGALSAGPPHPPAVVVEPSMNLLQVDGQPVSKFAICRNNESSVALITALLDSGMDDSEAILSSDFFLKLKVLTLLQSKPAKERHNRNSLPHEPVWGLHVGKHERLDLILVEDEDLFLHVRVEALEEHGQAREVLELDVVLPLHHAVHAGIPRPQRS